MSKTETAVEVSTEQPAPNGRRKGAPVTIQPAVTAPTQTEVTATITTQSTPSAQEKNRRVQVRREDYPISAEGMELVMAHAVSMRRTATTMGLTLNDKEEEKRAILKRFAPRHANVLLSTKPDEIDMDNVRKLVNAGFQFVSLLTERVDQKLRTAAAEFHDKCAVLRKINPAILKEQEGVLADLFAEFNRKASADEDYEVIADAYAALFKEVDDALDRAEEQARIAANQEIGKSLRSLASEL